MNRFLYIVLHMIHFFLVFVHKIHRNGVIYISVECLISNVETLCHIFAFLSIFSVIIFSYFMLRTAERKDKRKSYAFFAFLFPFQSDFVSIPYALQNIHKFSHAMSYRFPLYARSIFIRIHHFHCK